MGLQVNPLTTTRPSVGLCNVNLKDSHTHSTFFLNNIFKIVLITSLSKCNLDTHFHYKHSMQEWHKHVEV